MATECSSARHCQQPDLPVPIAVDCSLRPTGRFKHTCINCLRGIHKENSQVLRKYWEEVTKDMKDALSLEHCGIPLLDDDDDGEEIDVGQHACI